MRLQIDDNADLRGLAHAMVRQAVKDFRNRKKSEKSLDALLWLTGEDFGIWAEVWGMPFADPFLMLQTGGARKLR